MGLLCSWMGWQPVDAQTDVTAEYFANPSFEILKASDGTTDITTKQNLTGGLYGWTVAAMSDYGIESYESGSKTGFPADGSGKIEPTDGTYYYFNRQGWANKDSELKTTTTQAVPAGLYYLEFDYKAADYSNNNNWSANGTTIGLQILDANVYVLGDNQAVRRAYSFSNGDNKSNPEGNNYMVAAEWTKMGVCFEVKEATVITVAIQQHMRNSGRSDIIYDNLRLYSIDNVTSNNTMDITGLIANPSFATRSSVGWTGTDGCAVDYEAAEFYNRDFDINQTFSGLPNGVYEIQVSAYYRTGGEEKAYLYGNEAQVDIKSLYDEKPEGLAGRYKEGYADNMEAGSACFAAGFYVNRLERVVVTNGTLILGLANANHSGGSWCMFDKFKLIYKGYDNSAAIESLQSLIDEAKAYKEVNLSLSYLLNILNNKITAAETAIQVATKAALDVAAAELSDAMEAYKEAVLPLANLKGLITRCQTINEKSVGGATNKTAFENAIAEAQSVAENATTADEVNAAVNTLETARQEYVLAAQPAEEGFTFDYTFLVAGVGNSKDGWTKNYDSYNFQYQNASDKNTGDYVKQGYVETWNNAAYTGTLTYTKTGLPVGSYTLSAYAFGNENSGEVSLIANGVSAKLATTTSLYQNPTVSGVKVGEDGKLTFGLDVKNSTWVGITNIVLVYEGCDYDDYLVLKQQAESLVGKPMEAVLKEKLNASVSLQATATRQEIAQAVVTLQTTIPAARTSIANYAYLERETATAESFGIDVTAQKAAIADGTYDNEAAITKAQAMNVATYNKVKEDYLYDCPVDDWTGEIGTTSGQHWSGDGRSYYDTNGTGITRSLSTTVTLPAGEYVLMAAGRSHPAATMELKIDDTTVKFTAKGDTGYGIETSGQANFSESGDYANNGAGRGWEWEFVHLNLTEEREVTLNAVITTSGWAWGSFSDITLKMDKATFERVYYMRLEAALEECKPWNTGNEYADVTYPGYKEAFENKTYTDVKAIEQAIADLRTAFDAYAQENIDAEHSYDATSWIANPNYDNGIDGWERTQNSTDGYSDGVNADGAYYYSATKQMRHATCYQTISLPAGTYRLSATMTGNPYTEDGTYIYATTGAVDHWGSVLFAGDVWYGYYTPAHDWDVQDVYTLFTLKEAANVRIGALSWGRNASGNTRGGFTVDNWRLEKLLYAVDGDETDVVFVGPVPADIVNAKVAEGACSINLIEATEVSNMAIDIENNPNLLIYAKAGQVTNTQNVIIDGTCASLVLADGHSFAAPTVFTATSATYNMSAVATAAGGEGFGTLCLPFEATTLAGEAYNLNQGATMGGELYATKVASIPANTPVLVKVKGAYSGQNVSVAATKADAAHESGELVGVYKATPAPVGSFVLQKHNDKVAFYLVGNEVQPTVNPFRAYIRPQAEAASLDMLSVVFGFDDVTAVGAAGVADGVTEVSRYDATGVRIDSPRKGMNIVRMSDGSVRKVLVK